MTQIVYNGRYLLADRRCTYGYYTTIEAPKVFKIQVGDIARYFAFSGSFKECALGEEVIRTNFDPEVINKVRSVLGEDALEIFLGIVVDVSPIGKRVYLANYAGDLCELDPDQFVIVGAMRSEISAAWKVWEMMCENQDPDSSGSLNSLKDFVRFVTKGTEFDQTDRKLDVYDLETGELLCV
jgi:hypothetical protein|nr:MAG TPA: Proteasome subunit, ANCESTRAL, PROTEASOME, BETA-SUBUNIT, 20S [Caudoviricetes sp.]